MTRNRIGIVRGGGISSLGNSFVQGTNDAYLNNLHSLSYRDDDSWVSLLPDSLVNEINDYIKSSDFAPEKYSKEAKMTAYVIDQLRKNHSIEENTMLNVATSRGSLDYLANLFIPHEGLPVYASPHSTFGLLSSWPGQLTSSKLPQFFNSSTCSSFGMTLMNAKAWLFSGMTDRFIAAAVEAPAAAITVEQLKALRIYTNADFNSEYPSRAMDFAKKNNTMVLGEAAFAFLLKNNIKDCIASIDGLGVGVEKTKTATSITDSGTALINSIENSLWDAGNPRVDIIIGHFPGTIKGDTSEMSAYKSVYKSKMPYIIGNKWKIGHSLGSSLASNLDLAIFILERQALPSMPNYYDGGNEYFDKIKTIQINSLGFGGQAVSVVVSKVE